jgi:alkylation response protein AidB-like acyl-CoA dehydrogenase
VAVSEDVQNCADEGIQIYGGMGFSEDTQWKVPGDAELLVFMKVQTNQQNAICRYVDQKSDEGTC